MKNKKREGKHGVKSRKRLNLAIINLVITLAALIILIGADLITVGTSPQLNYTSPINNSWHNTTTPSFNFTSSDSAANGSIIPNLDNSLVSWWRMDDLNSSGGVVDYMGRNNGSNFSVTINTSGRFGSSMDFDGSGDYINTSMTHNFTAFSVSAWIRPRSTTTSEGGIIAKYVGGFVNGSWTLEQVSGNILWDLNDGGQRYCQSAFTVNTWNHVTGTYNGTSGILYINGVNKCSFVVGQIKEHSDIIRIGRIAANGDFNGSIDDVMIFNRSLTSNEIVSLYNATALNHQAIALSQGSHTLNVYAQNSSGNITSSGLINFGVDSIFPNITVSSPVNSSYYNNATPLFNVSSSEVGSSSIVPNLDGSLVSWWRMDDLNSSGGVVDYMGCYDNETEILTENGWKYFSELDKTEKVATLNNKTGEIEWQMPDDWQTFDNNQGMYKIMLEDGSELVVSKEHKVYLSFGNTLNPEYVNLNNLALKSEELTDLNNLVNEKCIDSINGGCISIKTIPEDSFGGNFILFKKCLSEEMSILSSDLDKLNICLSSEPNSTLFASNPSLFNISINSNGIFSSQRSFGLFLEGNITFSFNDSRSISQCRENGFFSNLGKISCENFIYCDSCSKELNYLPDHDSCTFECRGSSANFIICNNVFVNFSSHSGNNINLNLNNYRLEGITNVYSSLKEGKEIYFLNSRNKPVEVKSIEKIPYNGKIYDVDVENDIVLVRRHRSDEIWSGNSNNGTNVSVTQTDAGKFGKGMSFNGVDDYINIGTGNSLNLINNITISAWIYLKTLGDSANGRMIVGGYNPSGPWQGYGFIGSYSSGVCSDNTKLGFWDSVAWRCSNTGVLSMNNWIHVVAVYNGTKVTFYSNGNNVGIASAGSIASYSSSKAIGATGGGSSNIFNGSIDDVMIFNRSLTSQEIVSLYNATALSHSSINLSDGSHTFNAYVQDYAGSMNQTGLRTFNIDTVKPLINFTSPTPANISYQNYNSAMINVSVNDSGTISNNVSTFVDFDNSLVSWWRMDDLNSSGGVVDYMGRNNGTPTGAVQTDAGKFGKAMSFDGGGQYIKTATVNHGIGTGNFTWCAWIYSRNNNKGASATGPSIMSNGEYSPWFGIDNRSGVGNKLGIFWSTWYDFNTTVSENQWHQACLGRNGSTIYAYLDSVKDTTTFSIATSMANNYYYIGVSQSSALDSFNGSIEDVMIFNRSLSASEILALYGNQSAYYYSNNFTGLSDKNYTIRAYSQDIAGNVNSTEIRYFTVDTTSPNATLALPSNNSYYSNGTSINFTANLSDALAGLKNATLNIFNSSDSFVNQTNVSFASGTLTSTVGIVVTLVNGVYKWFYDLFDFAGNRYITANNTMTVDTVFPNITLTSPANNTYYNYTNVSFSASSSELGNGSIVPNLDGSLVSWWRMDDLNASGGVVDYMGRNNGTNVSVTQTDAGKFGKAMRFDGSDDYVNAGNSQSLNFSSINTITYSAWIYAVDLGESSSGRVIEKTSVFNFYIPGSSTTMAYSLYNSSGGSSVSTADNCYALNSWHNILITYNGSNVNFYCNGILKKTGNFTGNIAANTNNLVIGSISAGNLRFFNGSIDDVMIFNRSLTASEIISLYNATALSHSSINLSESNHTFNSYVQDLAGNVNQSGLINFVVDTTAPSANLSTPVNNYYSNSSSNNFTANLSDALAGLKNATLNIFNSSDSLVNQTNVSFASGTLISPVGIVVTLVYGIYKWFYDLFDFSGNRLITSNYTMTVDTVYPLINFTSSTPANNTAKNSSFVANISITELNLANVTWNWNGTISVFNSSCSNLTSITNLNCTISNTSSTEWVVLFNQSSIGEGLSYNYNVSVSDSAGNSNSTETRIMLGNTVPTYPSITQYPLIITYDDLDPGVNVTITANISDLENNFDTAILQWKNSTATNWNNITMDNQTAKSYYTVLNATLPLPSYESNITYRIWANDTIGDSTNSSLYIVQSFWDCTWNITTGNSLGDYVFGTVSGYSINKYIGNLTIMNTGDPEYSNNNCTIVYRVSHNLGTSRIYFDNSGISPAAYTVNAENNRTILVNASYSASSSLVTESLRLSVEDVFSRSITSMYNVSATLLTSQSGPYLVQEIQTGYPTSVYLTPGNFSLTGSLYNAMGDNAVPNANNTAYNVTFYWTLPSGLINISGNLTQNYTNISDNSLHYNNPSINFSELSSMNPGTKTFYLNSYGYNLTGNLIQDAANNILISNSINITFLCYNVSDSVCVTACGNSQDPDCPLETNTVTTPGSSSGGGGGSSGGSVEEKSEATFELLAGKQQEFDLKIENKLASKKENIKIKVVGINSEYISLEPSEIPFIEPHSSSTIKVRITAPAYFTEKEYTLYFYVTGDIAANFSTKQAFSERKIVTLHIVEVERGNIDKMINESMKIIEDMKSSNITVKGIEELLKTMQRYYDELNFRDVERTYNTIKTMKENAFESLKIMDELKVLIAQAESNGVKVDETRKLLYIAESAFKRGDFATALSSLKQAKLSYAIETKGEFNALYAIKNHPLESFYAFLAMLVFGVGGTLGIRINLYRRKIKYLHDEEKLLLELMKTIQEQCFEKGNLSMEEYREAMEQYENKLSETIKNRINTETRLANVLKVRGKRKSLDQERARLVEMIKDVQDRYLNKGQIETRIYKSMLEIYSKRLSEVEEQLTFIEAQDALSENKLTRKIINIIIGKKKND